MEEIEVKYLDINPKTIEKKIVGLGGKKIYNRIFRRYVFDYPDLRLNEDGAWLRLRDEGDKITMAYKKRVGMEKKGNDDSMIEIELEISDIEKMAELLRAIGMKDKFYEENRRIHFELEGVDVDIDEWPLLKPYLELEGESWEKLDEVAKKLGLDPKDRKIYPTWEVYKFNGINELDYKVLTFDKQIKR